MKNLLFITIIVCLFLSACGNASVEETSTNKAETAMAKTASSTSDQKLDLTVNDENQTAEVAKDMSTTANKNEAKETIELVDKIDYSNKGEMKEKEMMAKEKEMMTKKEMEKKAGTKSNVVDKIKEKAKEVVTSKPAQEVKTKVEKAKPVDVQKVESKVVAATNPTKKETKIEKPVVKKPAEFSHDAFNQLLLKHVSSSGKVNYANFKNDESNLDAYLKMVSENAPQSSWSSKKEIAYWINAYNAATIKLILKNYPLKQITSLHGGKPWDVKWIDIGGTNHSLNQIENDILRPKFKDARVHFAVNCAAKSCPPLFNKAWTPENLESNYERQTKAFINNTSFNKITEKEIEVSQIFEWYGKDFGDLITYLNKYSSVKIASDAKVSFKEYNWDLNN